MLVRHPVKPLLIGLVALLLGHRARSPRPASHRQDGATCGASTRWPPRERHRRPVDAGRSSLVGPRRHVTQPFLGDRRHDGRAAARCRLLRGAGVRARSSIRSWCCRDGSSTATAATAPATSAGWRRCRTPEGTYLGEAEAYRRFVEGLPRIDGRTLYVQIGNEPNLPRDVGRRGQPGRVRPLLRRRVGRDPLPSAIRASGS